MRTALLILGMHRSGTSAFAGAVSKLGLELGGPLLRGHKGINPKGYFENEAVHDFHEDVLHDLNSRWDDLLPLPAGWPTQTRRDRLAWLIETQFGEAPLFAVKDPRLGRLLPLWRQVLEQEEIQAKAIICLRPPEAIVASLRQRDGFCEEKSLHLFLDHLLQIERVTRDLPRRVLSYSDFTQEPVAQLQALGHSLSIDWPFQPLDRAQTINGFIEPGLDHSSKTSPLLESERAQLAQRLYDCLMKTGAGTESTDEFELIFRQFEDINRRFDPALTDDLAQQNARLTGLQTENRKTMALTTWKLTTPLRALERRLRRSRQ
ncbi:MAG: hypothetical protein R3360_00785 [Alphaproteobacteria bacterium]|nr:hypothetical protein [Alphaproteobacteria bacterium]